MPSYLSVITGFEAVLSQLPQCPHHGLVDGVVGGRRCRDDLVEGEGHRGGVVVSAHVLIPRVSTLRGGNDDHDHATVGEQGTQARRDRFLRIRAACRLRST